MSLNKKSKANLPKDWIVVNSTSFPDRIYYFNVRTGKSSWTEPRNDTNKTKPAQQSQKRKLSVDNEGSEAASEPLVIKTPPKASERRFLRAKRSVEVPKPPETPQMKAMRQKILAKKESKSVQNEKPKFSPSKSENDIKTASLDGGKANKTGKSIPKRNSSKSEIGKRVTNTRSIASCSSSSSISKSTASESSTSTRNSRTRVGKKKEPEVHSLRSNLSCRSSESNKNSANKRLNNLQRKLSAERKKIEPILNAKLKRRLSWTDSETGKVDTFDNFNTRIELPDVQDLIEPAEPLPSVTQNAVSRFKSLKASLISNPDFSNDEKNKQDEVTPPAPKTVKPNKKAAKKDAKSLPTENAANLQSPTAVQNKCNDSFWEEMEWEPIEDEKVVVEIQEVRMQISTEQATQEELPHHTMNILELSQVSENTDKRILYIITDTNVFLSNLKMVTEIIEDSRNIKSQFRPVVVVPWMVLQELDYIKDNKLKTKPPQLQKSARIAVDTLFRYFSSKHPRIKGQTAADAAANKNKFHVESPDDEILQCCLQIRELGYTVALLSNDKNLCNKAIIHDISTYGRHESIQEMLLSDKNDAKSIELEKSTQWVENKVETVDPREAEIADDIFCEAKAIMKHFLSAIVSKEMENLYGEDWKKYTIVQPPWSVIDVLKCISKHWMAVISKVFIQPAKSMVEKLSKMFLNASKYGQSLRYVCEVLDACSDLIQMVKSKDYVPIMEKSAQDVKELITMCKQKRNEFAGYRREALIKFENNNSNDEGRAHDAFTYFEQIWTFTTNFCGLSADLIGIPHSITYKKFEPPLSMETIDRMRPNLVTSLSQLISALRTVLEEEDHLTIENPALIALYQSLVHYLPNSGELNDRRSLNISDLLCCIRLKRDVLKTGLVQLQDLCYQFCRIADFQSSTSIVCS